MFVVGCGPSKKDLKIQFQFLLKYMFNLPSHIILDVDLDLDLVVFFFHILHFLFVLCLQGWVVLGNLWWSINHESYWGLDSSSFFVLITERALSWIHRSFQLCSLLSMEWLMKFEDAIQYFFKYMFVRCLLLNIHLATHQSSIGVWLTK